MINMVGLGGTGVLAEPVAVFSAGMQKVADLPGVQAAPAMTAVSSGMPTSGMLVLF